MNIGIVLFYSSFVEKYISTEATNLNIKKYVCMTQNNDRLINICIPDKIWLD